MINLTIIGLGKWGLELVKSVNKVSTIVRFNTAISRNPERIKKEAKKYNLSVFKNYNDLFNSKKVDGFVLCTPHSSHEKQIKYLSKYKKPIFVEKPLALNVKSAKKLFLYVKRKKFY